MPESNWKKQAILRFVLSNIISVTFKNRIFASSKIPGAERYRVMREGGAQRYGARELSGLICDTVSAKKLESMIN